MHGIFKAGDYYSLHLGTHKLHISEYSRGYGIPINVWVKRKINSEWYNCYMYIPPTCTCTCRYRYTGEYSSLSISRTLVGEAWERGYLSSFRYTLSCPIHNLFQTHTPLHCRVHPQYTITLNKHQDNRNKTMLTHCIWSDFTPFTQAV